LQVEILGSGGANAIPRPQCACRVCVEAREKGVPYLRTGPSVFVHGPDVLIDTPEEAKQQLDRLNPRRLQAALYSHWHPDHTQGRRLFEARNGDWRTWPPELRRHDTTPVYLTEHVAADFRTYIGLWPHFEFMQDVQKTVELRVVPDDEPIVLDGATVTPIRLRQEYVDAFLFEGAERRALVVMDELKGWEPPPLGRLDLAVLPLGIFALHPFTGERTIVAEHPVLRVEATYPETIEIARKLDTAQLVLSHVEHSDGLSHDDLLRLGERDGWVTAYDGLVL
jgi:phosphoribosyl 1,2-cyclic phosphate phosphodiesterase